MRKILITPLVLLAINLFIAIQPVQAGVYCYGNVCDAGEVCEMDKFKVWQCVPGGKDTQDTNTNTTSTGALPCTFTGCSSDHPGYSYNFTTTCSTSCTLGCDGKWPAWPSNYTCKEGDVCNKDNKCTPPSLCSPACAANQICDANKKCVPHPNCPAFVSASVGPSSARPLDQVTVKCNYGKRMDCATVSGAGLTNCRYSRYEGTDNIFTCDAGPNAGFYDDAKCVLSASTADKCCAASSKAGDITIVGSDVYYDQDMVLPFGTYTLSARVFSVISKGKGVRVSIICNSDTCTTGKSKNAEITSLTFGVSKDFAEKTLSVPLSGTGDDRHYRIRLSVDKGSEAYFDSISLKNTANKEFVVNGDFTSTVSNSVATKQPSLWGEGDNRIGYYYGSLANDVVSTTTNSSTSTTTTAVGTGGPTPTSGPASALSLDLKIKLQGVSKKPKTAEAITMLVKLDGSASSFVTQSKSVSFTVDDTGTWSGKADFDNVPVGGGYTVFVKAPKHIQKKICINTPSEATGGTYRCGDGAITLVKGANPLDFSKIILLAGDLPESNGKQNGIVDAYDTTFIRTNLGSTDAAKSKIGDLNFDGGIDTQDYSIVLQSLSIKFDEE